MRRAVHLEGNHFTVVDSTIDLANYGSRVYAIALGKAAPAMAAALDDVLGNNLISGVISSPAGQQVLSVSAEVLAADRWQSFAGGHPLPTQQSLNAARASIDLLERADHERALVLFLISGGGSAMMEWPSDQLITLDDLRNANQLLVSCGASIAEINLVRRAISAVKGGRLSERAPHALQITLIISDTNSGDEASVASGPSMEDADNVHDPLAVVAGYEPLAKLPKSILKAVTDFKPRSQPRRAENPARMHYVLLDNRTALEAAAAAAARQYGFITEMALDLVETEIAEGSTILLSRVNALRSRITGNHQGVCLISGGEFLCSVRGDGVGGRNAETVLRCAIEIEKRNRDLAKADRIVVLSAGTDGIDGNSPAAGAIADETTIPRARSLRLDAQMFLETSDAFGFFNKMGDAVVTGATGTNVRDVRILLAN